MKVGYPDTINNKAYEGAKISLEDGGFKDSILNTQAAEESSTPSNAVPLKNREMSDKRRARRKKRVERLETKANSIAEQKYLEGVSGEDLPTTPKKGKEKKYNRLIKRADKISERTTKILRKKNQIPSAKKGFESKVDRSKPGMSNAGKYPNVTKFAGPDGTFPINTLKRGRSALALAHNAKDPDAIKKKVYKEYPQLKDT